MNRSIRIASIWCTLLFLLPVLMASAGIHEQTGPSVPVHATITILQPEEGMLYVWSRPVIPLPLDQTIIIGPIVVQAGVTGFNGFEVDFYIDGEHKYHDNVAPFEYSWVDPCLGVYLITVELTGYGLKDSIKVFKAL